MDGVKSWLSKNKGSTKTLSDEGSLKSTRLVPTSLCVMTDNHVHSCGITVVKVPTFPSVKKAQDNLGQFATEERVFHVIKGVISLSQ